MDCSLFRAPDCENFFGEFFKIIYQCETTEWSKSWSVCEKEQARVIRVES